MGAPEFQHCPICRRRKYGSSVREMVALCEGCARTTAELVEVQAPTKISCLLVLAKLARNQYRYYIVLENSGNFVLRRATCLYGFGGREIEPEMDSLRDYWSTKVVAWWRKDYWPSLSDARYAIAGFEAKETSGGWQGHDGPFEEGGPFEYSPYAPPIAPIA